MLTPAEGLAVIATRSRLMARLSGQGAMALLELDAESAEALIADHPQVTVAVLRLAAPDRHRRATRGGRRAWSGSRPRIGWPGVSRSMWPPITGRSIPSCPNCSCAMRIWGGAQDAGDSETTVDGAAPAPAVRCRHWVANCGSPVRFAQAMATAGARHTTFVEMSPHPLLTHAIGETLESLADAAVVTSAMNREQDQTLFFHTQLAPSVPRGWAPSGVGWRTCRTYRGSTRPSGSRIARGAGSLTSTHPLLGSHTDVAVRCDDVWQADVGTDVCPWLADHTVAGQPILPAAAFAEIALAAGSEALDLPADQSRSWLSKSNRCCRWTAHTRITTQLSHGADGAARVEIHSRVGNNWNRHVTAKVTAKVRPLQQNGSTRPRPTSVAPVLVPRCRSPTSTPHCARPVSTTDRRSRR